MVNLKLFLARWMRRWRRRAGGGRGDGDFPVKYRDVVGSPEYLLNQEGSS